MGQPHEIENLFQWIQNYDKSVLYVTAQHTDGFQNAMQCKYKRFYLLL